MNKLEYTNEDFLKILEHVEDEVLHSNIDCIDELYEFNNENNNFIEIKDEEGFDF
jgi:hypothetical protein